MTSKKNKLRNARELNRKFKKKANPLAAEKVVFIDYKDVSLLQRFMTDRSKIRGQRMSGTNVQQSRTLAKWHCCHTPSAPCQHAHLAQARKAVKTRAPWRCQSSPSLLSTQTSAMTTTPPQT
jgi:ribosomal protein S18